MDVTYRTKSYVFYLRNLNTNNMDDVNIGVILIGSVATILLAWIGNKILK